MRPPHYRPREIKRQSCSTCHHGHHISLTYIRCKRYGEIHPDYVCDDYRHLHIDSAS